MLLTAVCRLDAHAGSVTELIRRVKAYAAAGHWAGPAPSPVRARASSTSWSPSAPDHGNEAIGDQLARYLGCAPGRPGELYDLPVELIEMVDGLEPDPITPPDCDLAG